MHDMYHSRGGMRCRRSDVAIHRAGYPASPPHADDSYWHSVCLRQRLWSRGCLKQLDEWSELARLERKASARPGTAVSSEQTCMHAVSLITASHEVSIDPPPRSEFSRQPNFSPRHRSAAAACPAPALTLGGVAAASQPHECRTARASAGIVSSQQWCGHAASQCGASQRWLRARSINI